MKILIYSYDTFQNLKSNPAYDLAESLIEKFSSKDVELIKLPVTYDSWPLLKDKIDSFNPDFVLGLGVAVGRPKLSIEKIALNYMHANVPDNSGKIFTLEKIDNTKPLAYETDFDVKNLLEYLNKNEVPSEISFNADTYICNYHYYNCLNYFQGTNKETLFIHVPASTKLVIDMGIKAPNMPTDLIAKGLYEYLKNLTP
jgi:pyroglutamyl-peptidase